MSLSTIYGAVTGCGQCHGLVRLELVKEDDGGKPKPPRGVLPLSFSHSFGIVLGTGLERPMSAPKADGRLGLTQIFPGSLLTMGRPVMGLVRPHRQSFGIGTVA